VHLGVQRDITEREWAEEEARILSWALENAVEGIALVSTRGRFLAVNRAYAASRGYEPKELVGKRWRSGFLAGDRAKLNSSYQRILTDGRAELEVNGTRKDGSIFCLQKMMVKVHDRHGQWIGHYCFTKDITDRKLADEALRKSAARLQVLSRRVVDVQEEERRHIARELHDQIGGVLSAISVNLHSVIGACDDTSAPRNVESIHIVDQAIEQVRNLSLDLRPAMLDELGLGATMRWYTDRQAQRAGFVPHFVVETSGVLLPDQVKIACFRIAQVALTNIVRHSQARQVWVELRQHDEDLELIVRDDGCGFDPSGGQDRATRGDSFGLLGMKERAELTGGRLDIVSRPGQGSTVRAFFPLAARPSA
jgi:PAS domain S-box-containing protein